MKKKLYLLLILIGFSVQAMAQSDAVSTPAMGEPSFGIFGGVNFQNINGKDDAGDKLTNSLVTRFHIGINEQLPIAPEFYFQVGLQFISKGTKGPVNYTDVNGTRSITREILINYLELPLHLVYKPMVGQGNLILGFGPYVGYSIGGKAKFTGSPIPADEMDLEFEKEVPSGQSNNLIYYKPLDVGADFFVGYQFLNGINLVLNSQLGLININSNINTKLANKNTGFGLSLGYRF